MAVYQIQFCLFNTVSEEDMLASMITYLEEENKTELSSILQVSKFIYSPQLEFLGLFHSSENYMQVYRCRYSVGKSLRTICKNCLRLLVKSISTMMSIIF